MNEGNSLEVLVADINWPADSSGSFKVVQLMVVGKEKKRLHLLFGPAEQEHHGRILQQILDDLKLNYTLENHTLNGYGELMVPALKGEDYRVVGMGCADFVGKKIIFRGDSGIYGMSLNKDFFSYVEKEYSDKRFTLCDY